MGSPRQVARFPEAARRRILRAYQRRGILDKGDRMEMEHWNHGGGFSLDTNRRQRPARA